MASTSVERLQAPFGGLNMDAAPDYVGSNQATVLTNLLPGLDGRVVTRGSIVDNVTGISATNAAPTAFWAFSDVGFTPGNDFALIKGNAGSGVKTWRVDLNLATKTDVTATLVESPLDYRFARYGPYVFGAIVDAASPQLGRWDGLASAIVPQANAPFAWTDLQVYANRLFILGGSVPGTTTPANPKTLYWTNPASSAGVFPDLSLLASWTDPVSGFINRLDIDTDDTPIALAGCGRYMAILGSRSVNVLNGSGASSFAVRNLSREWGCKNRESVVEVDDGFYWMSDRGFCFCDGTAMAVVSDTKVTHELTRPPMNAYSAASFDRGYIAVCGLAAMGAADAWLFNIASRTWSRFSMNIGSTYPLGVFRTSYFPILWQSGGLRRAERVTTAYAFGYDYDGSASPIIQTNWTSRFARLASPGQVATVRRLLLDYKYYVASADLNAWRVRLYDTFGNLLSDSTAQAQTVSSRRSRLVVDVNAEADAVQLVVTHAATDTSASTRYAMELFDAWIEFEPAQNRGSI